MRGLASRLSKAAKHPAFPDLSSCVFSPLGTNKNVILTRHPMDIHREKYLQIFHDDVIPVCQEIVPKEHDLHRRLGKMLNYNSGSCDLCWSFGVELAYRLLAPEAKQTESALREMRILRASLNMLYTMLVVIDDVADESPVRMGKPSWHEICEGGRMGATYDALIYFQTPFYLARKFFAGKPNYGLILETFARAGVHSIIGQEMDLFSRNSFDPNVYNTVLEFKAGKLIEINPTLGMLHAGICDRNLISKMEEIFHHFGTTIQIWDDFNEIHSSEALTGKCAVDSFHGSSTWASSTALKTLTGSQLQLFKDCYGSKEAEKRETVRRLYDGINLPFLYAKEMCGVAARCTVLIENLPEENLKKVCYSFLHWLIGEPRELELVYEYMTQYSD